jgi:hypothetical protein
MTHKWTPAAMFVAVLAVLALFGTAFNPHPASAQNAGTSAQGSAPVSIVSPLPVPVSGSLIVSNTSSNPILTRDIDNPAANAFSKNLCINSGTGFTCGPLGSSTPALPSSFTVPAITSTGAVVKRLLIQFVSGDCVGSARTTEVILEARPASDISLSDTGDNYVDNFIPMAVAQYEGNPGTNGVQAFATPTHISWDPGMKVSGAFDFATAGALACRVVLNGYFVTQ